MSEQKHDFEPDPEASEVLWGRLLKVAPRLTGEAMRDVDRLVDEWLPPRAVRLAASDSFDMSELTESVREVARRAFAAGRALRDDPEP